EPDLQAHHDVSENEVSDPTHEIADLRLPIADFRRHLTLFFIYDHYLAQRHQITCRFHPDLRKQRRIRSPRYFTHSPEFVSLQKRRPIRIRPNYPIANLNPRPLRILGRQVSNRHLPFPASFHQRRRRRNPYILRLGREPSKSSLHTKRIIRD